MNTIKSIRLFSLSSLMLLMAIVGLAQEKINKVSQTIKVDSDVTIDLNTNYVQIEIDTWNRNSVEVEAFVESETLSKEELKEVMENWDVDIDGSTNSVTITSKGNLGSWDMRGLHFDEESMRALRELELGLSDLPDIAEIPDLPRMPAMPELPKRMMEMPEMPEMPELPELPEGVKNVNFDYEEYEKEGEAYLNKWSAEYEQKYGKEYKEKMKAWAKKFAQSDWKDYEKRMEAWGEAFGAQFDEKYAKEMEEWGQKFGETWGKEYAKRMEAWGERYGKQMEERSKRLEERAKVMEERMRERDKLMEERQKGLAERQADMARMRAERAKLRGSGNQDVIKTIRIKMPKDGKLKMNVRHGELKLSSVINDMRADISYATLIADHIDGSKTSINVSYSPVVISNWQQGELRLNYVEKAKIDDAHNLVLSSNSSNIGIGNIHSNAIIEGTFGDLTINTISSGFKNVNIILENSDALINLPDTNYQFQYKGTKSRFSHPKSKDERATSFSSGEITSGKTLVINSKFSHVITQ